MCHTLSNRDNTKFSMFVGTPENMVSMLDSVIGNSVVAVMKRLKS